MQDKTSLLGTFYWIQEWAAHLLVYAHLEAWDELRNMLWGIKTVQSFIIKEHLFAPLYSDIGRYDGSKAFPQLSAAMPVIVTGNRTLNNS